MVRFPLHDVTIRQVSHVPSVTNPRYITDSMQVNPRECRLEMPGIGAFYMLQGRALWYTPCPNVDDRFLHDQMQGLPLAVLLHQRNILHFHAASFVFEGTGVLMPGQSGSGKSSLVAAFHLHGANILSDDLSAVVFDHEKAFVWPVYRKVRLRDETIRQLAIDPGLLGEKDPFTGKYTLQIQPYPADRFLLGRLLHMETYEGETISIIKPPMTEQFSLLRSEVCHWEILRGMPETEQSYLGQILQILKQTPLVRVLRPIHVSIKDLQHALAGFLQRRNSS